MPAAPPANDDCSGVVSLTVNADNLCGSTTSGTIENATASAQDATTCFGTEDDDVWFSFVATSTSHNISLINIAGSTTDMYHSVWEGTCPGLTPVAGTCSDPNAQTVTGLTIGNTYFIRVYTWTGTTGQTSTFDVCVGTDPPPLTITGCSGTFFDTGGAGGTYGASEDYTVSYCSGVAGQCISMAFTAFDTESCCDRLTVYDGPTTGSPQIGIYNGTSLNGQTLQSSTGCLTFVWHSNGSVQNAGWAANISCGACPTCSDGILNGQEIGIDCGGPTCPTCPCSSLPISNDEACCATSLTVNPDNLCGTTTAGTVLNATASFNSNTCGGTDDDDVWYSFVATHTTHYVSLLNIAGSTTDMYHAVYGGTCSATGASLVCSDANSSTVTGLTIGNTYFIRVYTYTGTTGQNSTFDVCVGSPPPPPVNDECSGAISLTVNPDLLCGTTTTATIASASASSQDATACAGTEDDDVWFSFVATNTEHKVSLLNVSGSTTDMYHSIWEGTCPGLTLFAGTCRDPNSQTVTGLTIGNTYFIRVYTYTATVGQTSTFDVCVGSPPPPPVNDECSGAISLTVNPDLLCGTTTTATIASASASSQDATACAGTEDDDVWFSFVATNTEHKVSLLNVSGSTTDMYHSIWEGTCPGLTLFAGTCSDPNSQTVTGLTIGNTYFVRVYTYTATVGQTSVFDICIGTPPPIGPCGNYMYNDFCSDPGTLTQGTGTWNYSTANNYTADNPANISIFCGSIENNSWYQFTALATTETFTFAGVGGTSCGSGIQVEIYDVTTDANGCCTNFTSMSNCFNPGTQTGGTVTASGLTIGNTYYMMIDGNAGAGCDFSVAGWDVSLPIELIKFEGYNFKGGNKLNWSTATEINNDYFIVQKSSDAQSFENIGIVNGYGNSNSLKEYSFIDDSPRANEVAFYRLRQIDFDGKYSHSKILIIETKEEVDVKIYPNPTSNNFSFDISESDNESYTVIYTNVMGANHREQINISEGSNTYEVNEFKSLATGIYFVQIINGNNQVVKSQKVIKK